MSSTKELASAPTFAGAAGITVAREFLGSHLSVVVLEGGGLDNEAVIQKLNEGEVVGLPHAGIATLPPASREAPSAKTKSKGMPQYSSATPFHDSRMQFI